MVLNSKNHFYLYSKLLSLGFLIKFRNLYPYVKFLKFKQHCQDALIKKSKTTNDNKLE